MSCAIQPLCISRECDAWRAADQDPDRAFGIVARQVCAFQFADVLVLKNCRHVVLLKGETADFVSIVSGDDGNASIKEPVSEAAGAAEEIDGDGATVRSSRVSYPRSQSLMARHSQSVWVGSDRLADRNFNRGGRNWQACERVTGWRLGRRMHVGLAPPARVRAGQRPNPANAADRPGRPELLAGARSLEVIAGDAFVCAGAGMIACS